MWSAQQRIADVPRSNVSLGMALAGTRCIFIGAVLPAGVFRRRGGGVSAGCAIAGQHVVFVQLTISY